MLLAEQNGGVWPLVGVVVAMLLLLMTFWRTSRRAASRWESAWPKSLPAGGSSSAGAGQPAGGSLTGRSTPTIPPAELTAWEVQMHETVREVSALVDTKLRLLQHLVAEADRAATRLERALAAAQTSLSRPSEPSPVSTESLVQPGTVAPLGTKGLVQPESPVYARPEPAASPQPEPAPSGATEPASSVDFRGSRGEGAGSESACGDSLAVGGLGGPSPVRPEALALEVGLFADYGFPPEEIASRCGISLSEVERILCERNRQEAKDAGQ